MKIASTAPAAPRQWPVAPFVDETGVAIRLLLAERELQDARLRRVTRRRRRSVRVDVAHDLGLDARVGERHPHRTCRVRAARIGIGDVARVGGDAVAEHLARRSSRRARARARAPRGRASPLPRPSRSRRAPSRTAATPPADRRCAATARASRVKPAMPTRVIGASVPPQNITSARPRRIASSPSPIAMFEAAHAVHSAASGPCAPSSIETHAAAMFGMIWTIANGLVRSGPRSSRLWKQFSNGVEPADPGGDGSADAIWRGGDRDPAVRLRHPRGRERELREAVHAPRLLAVDPDRRVEVLELAGEVDVVAGRVEVRDRAGARLAGDEALPGRVGVVPERRHHADAGDDDAAASVLAIRRPSATSPARRRPAAPRP